jgi:hypothetical protein
MESVRRFFPGLNAIQAVALTRDAILVLTAGQAIELLQEFFPELDAPEVIVLIRDCFPELDAAQGFGLIRRNECPALQRVMKGVFRKEPPMKKVKIRVDRREVEIDVPEGINAPGLSRHLGELIAVVSLRCGSGATGGLSARVLANVAVRNWSDYFTFIVDDHRYRCPSSIAQ